LWNFYCTHIYMHYKLKFWDFTASIERFYVHCHSEEPTGDEESQKAAPPRRFFAVSQNDMDGAACTRAVH